MRIKTPEYFQAITIQGNVINFGGKFTLTRYPVEKYDVANKEYVDDVASNLTTDYNTKIDSVVELLNTHESDTSVHLTPSQNTLLDNLNVSYTELNYLLGATSNIQQQINSKVNRTGDTFTGIVSMSVDPINPQDLTTKNYVDTALSTKLDKTATAVAAQKLSTARKINGVDFDGTSDITINAVDATPRIPMSYMGVSNGVATLDANGLVPSTQLPSYVDDVLSFDTLSAFPNPGETGKIYVANDTNYVYRWTGSNYIQINTHVGVADVATKLATARKINGTNFDGTSDITTTSWGTARTITIGNTAKSVDGSANVSWTITDIIGYTPVNKAGDTMTGALTLASDPTAALQAATKQYVDNGLATKLSLSGGTLTGALNLASDPSSPYQATTKQYVDNGLSTKLDETATAVAAQKLSTARKINGVDFDGTSDITINAVDATPRIPMSYMGVPNGVATLDSNNLIPQSQIPSIVYDILEYDTLTNFPATGTSGKFYIDKSTNYVYRWNNSNYVKVNDKVSLADNATKLATARKINGTNFDGSVDITTSSWGNARTITIGNTGKSVDGSINVSWSVSEVIGYTPVNKAGDTMTGSLTLSSDPTAALQAATKQYVDNGLATKLSLSGGTLTGALTLAGDPTTNLHAATKQYVDNLVINVLGNLTTAFNNLSTTFANYGR